MWKMKCNILRFSSSLFHLEKLWTIQDASEAVVTALCVSKGMLWLGTSIGVILTLPLPRLRFVLLLHFFFQRKSTLFRPNWTSALTLTAAWIRAIWQEQRLQWVNAEQSLRVNCTGAGVPLGRRGFSHSSLLGLWDYSYTADSCAVLVA